MIVDEQDLGEIRRSGGKIRAAHGGPLKDVSAPDKEQEEHRTFMKAMLTAVRDLTQTMKENAKSDTPEAAAPQITVEAPNVEITSPKSWQVEVTSRDADKRIKTIAIKAVE